MLPSEIIVETVEVALSRPTLVVCFDNVLLFTVPVIGYDAAVGVPVTEKIWCTVFFPLSVALQCGNENPP